MQGNIENRPGNNHETGVEAHESGHDNSASIDESLTSEAAREAEFERGMLNGDPESYVGQKVMTMGQGETVPDGTVVTIESADAQGMCKVSVEGSLDQFDMHISNLRGQQAAVDSMTIDAIAEGGALPLPEAMEDAEFTEELERKLESMEEADFNRIEMAIDEAITGIDDIKNNHEALAEYHNQKWWKEFNYTLGAVLLPTGLLQAQRALANPSTIGATIEGGVAAVMLMTSAVSLLKGFARQKGENRNNEEYTKITDRLDNVESGMGSLLQKMTEARETSKDENSQN